MPAPSPPTLNIVGAGRVAQTLAHLWTKAGCFAVQDVLTRSPESAQAACAFIGAGQARHDLHSMRPADVWMVAVPDALLADAAQALASASAHAAPSMAFHCSGAQSAATLAPLAALGWRTASTHCILSFATATVALQQFSGTPCALEGDADVCTLLRPAFTTIGARCFDVAGADKVLYHAAAIFATNFLPVLQATAENLWRTTGVPEDIILQLRSSLLHNSVANITRMGPKAALTGPAARGDLAAIARQGAALADWNPKAGDAYRAMSALALALAQGAEN